MRESLNERSQRAMNLIGLTQGNLSKEDAKECYKIIEEQKNHIADLEMFLGFEAQTKAMGH
jgi:hypothetical protein